MSQAPRGKQDWIRDHYEKAILLVGLLAMLGSCVWLAQRIQADKDDSDLSLTRINWKGSPVGIKDTVPFDKVLAKARDAATVELTTSPRTTVSELRVACVKCEHPIPYDAIECPFCLAAQPAIINIDDLDTDKDGLHDKDELAWNLNPQDPADANGDLDNDGFTNAEEHGAKTDPKDSNSFPDPVVKLRVAAIRPVPFYLRFVSTSTFGDGSIRFQLNLQSKERTYFAKIGDVILGYAVASYDPQGVDGETLTMVRQSDKRPVALIKGRFVTEQELAILFVFMVDRSKLPVQRLNDVFGLRGVEYKVVDIRRESVLIQSVKTGEKVTVPLLSNEERATASGRASAPAPSVEPAPAW